MIHQLHRKGRFGPHWQKSGLVIGRFAELVNFVQVTRRSFEILKINTFGDQNVVRGDTCKIGQQTKDKFW